MMISYYDYLPNGEVADDREEWNVRKLQGRLTSEVGLAQWAMSHLHRSQIQFERKVPELTKADPV